MPQIDDIKAWISVDGAPLEEYNTKVIPCGMPVTLCWIASEIGKRFVVEWEDFAQARTTATTGLILVDGIQSALRTSNRPFDQSRRSYNTKRSMPYAGVGTSRGHLVFAPLCVIGGEEHEGSVGSGERIGDIVFSLLRTEKKLLGEEEMAERTERLSRAVPEFQTPVHERSKKAGLHRTQIEEDPSIHVNDAQYTWVDKLPLATFIFRYRPRGVPVPHILRANGIIPQSAQVEATDPTVEIIEIDSSDIEEDRPPSKVQTPKNKFSKKRRANTRPESNEESGNEDEDTEIKLLQDQLKTLEEIKTIQARLVEL
ncbi:hypothetical protein JAAARDRAFT_473162 [Jaapia argillacea MUCL 33604]|uniref:DUF7918 domain-containing protein n=1 Tax=Jaapia argillacea MUCL 33604 TaxID=933084 RepID=A0A067PFP4_9AGAM|nr:hypothetical protein JAAARDRAFT_473162 [Jaapia argillacea MUCL 33604]